MTHVLLYWNHICVLHKGEKQFLDRLADSLRLEGIRLEVRHFGLGYPEHMSEYLARPSAVLPDMIVSADLEVFEDERIYGRFRDDLYPAAHWIPLRKGPALEAVWREERLLPFLSIPLVYYTRQPKLCSQTSIYQWKELAFGGIDNSAAKTLVKSVWSRWGKEAARFLLEQSHITPMPIGAFQLVRTGVCHTALVPSLYALRADGENTFLCIPREGPVLIPSYFCARTSVAEALARRIAKRLLCPELCRFYREQGDLIVYPDRSEGEGGWEEASYVTPSASWLEATSSEEFYALYCDCLPAARPLKT